MTRAYIQNHEALTNVFGEWPSFHDAEIVSMRLERGRRSPFLEMQIHVFQVTKDIDETDHFTTKRHTLVTIRFDEIEMGEIVDFNAQNVISELSIERNKGKAPGFIVDIASSYGCAAGFKCSKVSVVRASPYTREARLEAGSAYVR